MVWVFAHKFVTALGRQSPHRESASAHSCGQRADQFGLDVYCSDDIGSPRVDEQVERRRQLPVVAFGPFAAPFGLPGPT